MAKRPSVSITNHGSIVSFRPLTRRAKQWFADNIEAEGWQWLGGSLVVDHRLAHNLADGLTADGLI